MIPELTSPENTKRPSPRCMQALRHEGADKLGATTNVLAGTLTGTIKCFVRQIIAFTSNCKNSCKLKLLLSSISIALVQ